MNDEKRYSTRHGVQGCLVAMMFISLVSFSISLVFTTWLGLMSIQTERRVMVVVWLLGASLGGYAAARFGKTTGWTNSLIVGLIAEFLIYAQVPKGSPDQTMLDPLLDLVKSPNGHWRVLAALALTIPAAIFGGVIWEYSGGAPSSAKEESEKLTNERRPEE
jgi:hypothetical protein